MSDELYDFAEAAAKLRVTETWLRRNVRPSGFPYLRLGGRTYFTPDQLEEIKRICEVRPHELRPIGRRRRPNR